MSTQKAEHSLTPWEQQSDLVWSPSAKAVVAVACEPRGSKFCEYKKLERDSPDFYEGIANAAHIVKCVNAYGALVEAVQFVKAFLSKLEDDGDEDDPLTQVRRRFHAPLHAKIDAALRLAE